MNVGYVFWSDTHWGGGDASYAQAIRKYSVRYKYTYT